MSQTRRSPAGLSMTLYCVIAGTLAIAASAFAAIWMATASVDARAVSEAQAAAQQNVVKAAEAFLATLDSGQRAKAVLDLNAKTRTIWSNLPSGIAMQVGATERNGLKIGDMTPAQEKAALALLAAALSREGYEKAMAVVDADELLEQRSAPTRKPGSRTIFGRKEFYLAILGKPSPRRRWMLQFGGHHLAVNVTYAGGAHVLTPTHTGAQPASFSLEGRTVRPWATRTTRRLRLMNALTAEQQKQATLGVEVRNLVLGPGEDGKMIAPEGVKASSVHTRTARAAARSRRRMGPHPRRCGGQREAGGGQEQPQRHLLRVGRRDDKRQPGVFPDPGPGRVHRVRDAEQGNRSHSHHLS